MSPWRPSTSSPGTRFYLNGVGGERKQVGNLVGGVCTLVAPHQIFPLVPQGHFEKHHLPVQARNGSQGNKDSCTSIQGLHGWRRHVGGR